MGTRAQSGLVRTSGNILLSQLSPADQALLEPHAGLLLLAAGEVLIAPEDEADALFFPGTALLSIHRATDTGRPAEVALVGREGMVGWAGLLGAARSDHVAVAQMRPGTLLRIGLTPLRSACARSPTLLTVLLRFVNVVIEQMAHAIACSLECPLEQRLARWLLMRHDRIGGDILAVHHEEIAGSLAVRRASVTDHLHLLEGQRCIKCNRGKIIVRERSALERMAGPAYGNTEAHYRALIAPFGKSLAA